MFTFFQIEEFSDNGCEQFGLKMSAMNVFLLSSTYEVFTRQVIRLHLLIFRLNLQTCLSGEHTAQNQR